MSPSKKAFGIDERERNLIYTQVLTPKAELNYVKYVYVF